VNIYLICGRVSYIPGSVGKDELGLYVCLCVFVGVYVCMRM
jgi:hypothetical protein